MGATRAAVRAAAAVVRARVGVRNAKAEHYNVSATKKLTTRPSWPHLRRLRSWDCVTFWTVRCALRVYGMMTLTAPIDPIILSAL